MLKQIILHSPNNHPPLKDDLNHLRAFFGGEPTLLYQCCLDLLVNTRGKPSISTIQQLTADMVGFCKGSMCNYPSKWHEPTTGELITHTLTIDLYETINGLLVFFTSQPLLFDMLRHLKIYHQRLRVITLTQPSQFPALGCEVVPNPPAALDVWSTS